MKSDSESSEKLLSSDSEYMNDKQLDYFRKKLIDWKKSISEHNLEAKHRLQSDTAPLPDPSDRASLEEDFALALRDRDRERKLINKINKAIDRTANKSYGYCESCEEEIGSDRLEARPIAEFCFDCKELFEKKELKIKELR